MVRTYVRTARPLCCARDSVLPAAGCCAGEVLQVFDAGRGPERDVCLLREVVERAVGVAQDDKGCVISDLSDSQQVRCGMRAQEAHMFVQPCTV